MQLNVNDIARILQVPVSRVHRWIHDNELPVQMVREQPYINRSELLEWAMINHLDVSPEIFRDRQGNYYSPIRFARSIAEGIMCRDVPSTSKQAVLQQVVSLLPIIKPADRELLLELFQARENTGSTAVGDGLAIPHPLKPIVLVDAPPTISVFYLQAPVEFGAKDGKPVHTLFVMLAPSVQKHLHLLARLSFALHDKQFHDAVLRRVSQSELLEEARRVESLFDRRSQTVEKAPPSANSLD